MHLAVFPVNIHCDSVPLSNDNEFITTEPTKKMNERAYKAQGAMSPYYPH